MVIHPEYPELEGLAKVTYAKSEKIVTIKFEDDEGSFFAHVDYIRLATNDEIKNHFSS